MQKPFFTICMLTALAGSVQAAPVDSPDTVYIDGRPCGPFCQRFFDASTVAAAKEKMRPVVEQLGSPEVKTIVRRSSGRPIARHRTAARSRMALAVPKVRPPAPPHPELGSPPNAVPPANAPEKLSALPLEQASDLAVRLSGDAQQEIAKTEFNSTSVPTKPDDATGSIPLSDPRVILLITKNDVGSVPELAHRSVGVDRNFSQSSPSIRLALVAAGAPEVEILEDPVNANDRLNRSEVQASVLGLVSKNEADTFPAIDGYRIFRVPLSPP